MKTTKARIRTYTMLTTLALVFAAMVALPTSAMALEALIDPQMVQDLIEHLGTLEQADQADQGPFPDAGGDEAVFPDEEADEGAVPDGCDEGTAVPATPEDLEVEDGGTDEGGNEGEVPDGGTDEGDEGEVPDGGQDEGDEVDEGDDAEEQEEADEDSDREYLPFTGGIPVAWTIAGLATIGAGTAIALSGRRKDEAR